VWTAVAKSAGGTLIRSLVVEAREEAMNERWQWRFLCLLTLGICCVLAFRQGTACTQDCNIILMQCFTNAQGNCDVTNPPSCYRWETPTSGATFSCWTCGKGNEGSANGWCIVGDADLVCKQQPDPKIKWRRYSDCETPCKKPTKHVEAILVDPTEMTGAPMSRYLCEQPPPGSR
jgi:hypothetical protein